jgi:hypothetical protein
MARYRTQDRRLRSGSCATVDGKAFNGRCVLAGAIVDIFRRGPSGVGCASYRLRCRLHSFSNSARALVCAAYFPCFQAFRFPFGAPGLVPPCIRQRPFRMGALQQRSPHLVLAPQRLVDAMNSASGK